MLVRLTKHGGDDASNLWLFIREPAGGVLLPSHVVLTHSAKAVFHTTLDCILYEARGNLSKGRPILAYLETVILTAVHKHDHGLALFDARAQSHLDKLTPTFEHNGQGCSLSPAE